MGTIGKVALRARKQACSLLDPRTERGLWVMPENSRHKVSCRQQMEKAGGCPRGKGNMAIGRQATIRFIWKTLYGPGFATRPLDMDSSPSTLQKLHGFPRAGRYAFFPVIHWHWLMGS